jgi:DNA-binding IclR family transcriptional regulator
MTKRPKSEYAIQTVSNAFRLLEAFQHADELGVTELAVRLRLHKNNVFRLLATLQYEGYVEQDPRTEFYRLGVRCLELAHFLTRGRPLVQQARPVLERLASDTREAAHVAVMREFEVVHLDGEVFPQVVLTKLRVGQGLPTHCTALGKVLLAFADDATRESYDRVRVTPGHLDARTPATLVDREKLFEHLRSVASQGFAIDLEEYEPGVVCIAAPVFDASGHAIAALSVSGPAFRLDLETLQRRVIALVMDEADRLSQRLGQLHT